MLEATTNSLSVSMAFPGPISLSQLPGGVMAAGITVSNQDGVAPICREPTVGLVGDPRLGQHGAVLQPKIADREEPVLDRADILGAQRYPVDHRDFPRQVSAVPAIVHAGGRCVMASFVLSGNARPRYTGAHTFRGM